ncbi:MAG TPA: PspC domain-containing protein [Gemmatimonadaceae bacterium]|nr:PspC domain-containing protein [Gemmatimonadaceae bacterium]
MHEPRKELRRSRSESVIAGVLGGIARYFGWDPTVVRVAYVVGSVLSAAFPGTIVYIILWIIMPLEEERLY